MRLPWRSADRPDIPVAAGERLLAWAGSSAGPVGGTRSALYLPGRRVPWEQVHAADWDSDESVLQVAEVGDWGQQRPVHRMVLDDPDRLLQLVRERVTSSILLERQVAVTGRRGLRVVARRAPGTDQPPTWFFDYDEGVDPDDPAVREAARRALAEARVELGQA